MKHVLFIVGSLRKESLNQKLSEYIARKLNGEVHLSWLYYEDIPSFNQDHEHPLPSSIKRILDTLKTVDGVWFVTPEYNASMPGHLKNLLDWITRPFVPGDLTSGHGLSNRLIAVSGIGGKRATSRSREHLTEVLAFVQCRVLQEQTGIAFSNEQLASNTFLLSEEDQSALDHQIASFLAQL